MRTRSRSSTSRTFVVNTTPSAVARRSHCSPWEARSAWCRSVATSGGSHYANESLVPGSQSTGWYLASGIGFATAFVGFFWLIDCNQRGTDIEDRIEQLRRRGAFAVLPAVDPKAGTAGLTLTGRF